MSENFFKSPPIDTYNFSSTSIHTNLESAQLSRQVFALSPEKNLTGGATLIADKAALALNAAKEAISPLLQIIMRLPGHIGFINSMFEAIGAFFMPALDLDFLHQINILHTDSHSTTPVGLDGHTGLVSHNSLESHNLFNHSTLMGHDAINLGLIPHDAPVFSQLHYSLDSPTNIQTAGSTHFIYLAGHDNPTKALFETDNLSPKICEVEEVSPNQSFELMNSKPIFTEHSFNTNIASGKIGFDKISASNNNLTNSGSSNNLNSNSSLSLSRQQLVSGNATNNSTISSSNWAGYELKLGSHNVPTTTSTYGPSGEISSKLGEHNLIADANTTNDGFKPWSDNNNLSNPTDNSIHTNLNHSQANATAQSSSPVKELEAKELSLDPKTLQHNNLNLKDTNQLNKTSANSTSIKEPNLVNKTSVSSQSSNQTNPGVKSSIPPIEAKPTALNSNSGINANHELNKSTNQVVNHKPQLLTKTHNVSNHTLTKSPNSTQEISPLKSVSKTHADNQYPKITKPEPAINNPNQEINHQTQVNDQMNSQVTDQNTQTAESTNESNNNFSYEIKTGDNLWNIAKSHLGNGLDWKKIYEMNQNILGSNPDLIRPGTMINLPNDIAATSTDAANQTISYTVNPGDNLWNIAKSQLGNATDWKSIYTDNQSVIGSNPSLIFPGQHLNIHSHFMNQGSVAGNNLAQSQTSINTNQITQSTDTNYGTSQPNQSMTAPLPNQGVAPTQPYLSPASQSPTFTNPSHPASSVIEHKPNISSIQPSSTSSSYGAAYAATLNNKSVVSPNLAPDLGFER